MFNIGSHYTHIHDGSPGCLPGAGWSVLLLNWIILINPRYTYTKYLSQDYSSPNGLEVRPGGKAGPGMLRRCLLASTTNQNEIQIVFLYLKEFIESLLKWVAIVSKVQTRTTHMQTDVTYSKH